MGRRKIKTGHAFNVYWDREWGEYQVEPRYGSINERRAGTYHTGDKQDALDTWDSMEALDAAMTGNARMTPKQLVMGPESKGF